MTYPIEGCPGARDIVKKAQANEGFRLWFHEPLVSGRVELQRI
jgi:hypothetical protein